MHTEALALIWAAQIGAVSWQERTAWADRWILELNEHPEALLDLSLSGGQSHRAWSLLRQLARHGGPGEALPLLARRLLNGLEAAQVDPLDLAARLEDVNSLSSQEEPDDVRLPAPAPQFWEATRQLVQLHVYLDSPPNQEEVQNVTEEVVSTLRKFL